LALLAPERPGPGVPGQVPPAPRGDPGVRAGQRQVQARPREPRRLDDRGEARPQGAALGGRRGGRLVGASLRHAPLEIRTPLRGEGALSFSFTPVTLDWLDVGCEPHSSGIETEF